MTERERMFQSFSDRLVGRPVDSTLYEDVQPWMVRPLRDWIRSMVPTGHAGQDEPWVAEAVIRLRWHAPIGYRNRLLTVSDNELLDAVDAVLQLDPGWDAPDPSMFLRYVDDLVVLLDLCGSAYTVFAEGRCLVRRVDQTAEDAAAAAISVAPTDAADHLRHAWVETYGRNPDPDKAYAEAVKAVEAVAAPLITPNADGRRTLGKAIADLKNQRATWQSVIGDPATQPLNIDRWIGMLELLWTGQVRHSGNTGARRHTPAEAEAAAHLAATLVHWLSTQVLRKASDNSPKRAMPSVETTR